MPRRRKYLPLPRCATSSLPRDCCFPSARRRNLPPILRRKRSAGARLSDRRESALSEESRVGLQGQKAVAQGRVCGTFWPVKTPVRFSRSRAVRQAFNIFSIGPRLVEVIGEQLWTRCAFAPASRLA